MAEPFLSEIRIFSFHFAPKGWALANGQILAIAQNQALFSLLGTTFGGDGTKTFALPNFQGRVPIHVGQGYTFGQQGGEINHTLINNEMPNHTHVMVASSQSADSSGPGNGLLANSKPGHLYQSNGSSQLGTLSPASVSNTGGSQPHLNLQPLLVLNFSISLQGIFPSQT